MVIPAVVGNKLVGFIVLGERKEKGVYSPDMINVLAVVGNQMALAMQNIMFMAEREKWLNEDFERRRSESLATLSTSISHQVNNRFHAIMQRCAVPWTIYSDGKYKDFVKEEFINLVELFGKSLQRILSISEEGGKITQTILDYAKGKMSFGVVPFDETINKSLRMTALRRPDFQFDVTREYPQDVLLWAAEVPLQDIIVNALDNSCFAMNVKKEQDQNYHPRVIIRGQVNKTEFHFEIEDNGMGIKKENLKKVMDPMFSTKSHRDGTGMGTTIMHQFIQKHGGTIAYDSGF
jgi:signal transduction histidine kinase